MDEMKWYEMVIYIVTPLVTVIVIIFQLYLNSRFKIVKIDMNGKLLAIEERLGHIDDDIKELKENGKASNRAAQEIQKNYLRRFDEVKDTINQGTLATVKELGKINNSITALSVEIKNHIEMEQ